MALLLAGLASVPLAESRVYPSLFGSQEFAGPDLGRFPKWMSMLSRWRESAPCEAADCTMAGWHDLIDSLRGADLATQLRSVNDHFNATRYIRDARNWGKEDYWETPFEFLKRRGDCEDYAIAKFMALKALGVPASEMRILALRNLALGGEGHAVLIVYAGGTPLMLDNQIKDVVPANSVGYYQPVYSLNETGWWRHETPRKATVKPSSVLPASL
ncbi:transglutaminase-like cysteine peptidase [Dongia sp.]|uniref:transglutaminase-like cysteine peptidase n=1 Tax=Dongia sp. TaxID=1977262 RepID=UPI0035B0C2DF